MTNQELQKPFVFYSDKLNFKSIDGAKGKEFWVEGYITTGDMDLVNDIVTKGCRESVNSQFGMRAIKLDFEHETLRGKGGVDTEAAKSRIPLGKEAGVTEDAKGVKVKWKMNPTWKKFDEKGNVVMTFKDVWSNVEEGYYDAFSIAYVPTRTAMVERDGKSIRLLDDINLLNVALTGNPINPAASMTSVMAKSLDYMKEQEDKSNNPDPTDLNLLEVKSQVDSLKTEISNIKLHMGCKDMADNEDAEAKAKAEADAKAKVDAEAKSVADAEAKAKIDADSKSMIDMKSRVEKLEADMKSLTDENVKINAVLGKAQQKSKGAENNEQKGKGQETPMVGPLDMI